MKLEILRLSIVIYKNFKRRINFIDRSDVVDNFEKLITDYEQEIKEYLSKVENSIKYELQKNPVIVFRMKWIEIADK